MKTLTGIVVSNKMNKTIIVEVLRMWQHPVYKKRVKRSKRYFVHSEEAIAEGKKVRIGETRPISKNKRWKVIEVLKH